MRFSDTFLRQLRDRVSIYEYADKKLAWDRKKSRPSAGDFWACCPFHQEKSASFHVLDRKGLYNCFGCGEKGDVFTLAMKLEGMSFPESVKRMAEIAGMALPTDEHEDRGEAERRTRLYTVSARAAALYASALLAPEGKAARAYLENRGLNRDLWARFGIGFAPDGYTWALDKLRAEGFSVADIAAAGLAYPGEDGRRPSDVFHNRITFEIADPGGKVIAFGGRALDPGAKAKYLNSPETILFHKGRTLYRLKQAREILSKTKAEGVVVAEGYLDVIAFERAGIAAVAPLGTALTEDQLQLAWRAGPTPILCFDGDSAGHRAADRALELALPYLGPDRTVKIAVLPPGEDPDDVFRRAGPEALAPLLATAQPASEALFQREKTRRTLDTPEARAAFKEGLRQAAFKIADPETKKQYLSDLLARADAETRPPRAEWVPRAANGQKGRFRATPPEAASAELKAKSSLRPKANHAENFLRAAIDHPGILDRYGDWIDRLELGDRELEAIRDALQTLSGAEEALSPIDRAALSLHLQRSGEERALARLSRWPKPRELDEASGDVEAEWLASVTLEVVLPAIREEMAELRPRADDGDDDAFARFQALGREALEIEARARKARLEEAPPDDLVA